MWQNTGAAVCEWEHVLAVRTPPLFGGYRLKTRRRGRQLDSNIDVIAEGDVRAQPVARAIATDERLDEHVVVTGRIDR